MSPILTLLLIAAAVFIAACLFGRLLAHKLGGARRGSPDPGLAPRKRPKRRNGLRNFALPQGDEFPYYDASRNDEANWRNVMEPQFRKHEDYPPDWQRRRALVFIRDKGRCQGSIQGQHCGRLCGRLLCEPNQIWSFKYDETLLVEAHVHHVKNRASNGDHDLRNLRLICPRCHMREHSGNHHLEALVISQALGGGRNRKTFLRNLYRRKAPRAPGEDVPF